MTPDSSICPSASGGQPAALPDGEASVLDIDPRSPRAARPSPAARLAVIVALALGLTGIVALRPTAQTSPPPAPSGAPASEPPTLADRCTLREAVACNDLGVQLLRGEPILRDPQAAFHAFVRACDGASADGCSNLGALYERGLGTGENIAAARALYERACNAGNALGCSNLGALYAHGRGQERDREAAQHLFELACETGSATGCSNLEALLSR